MGYYRIHDAGWTLFLGLPLGIFGLGSSVSGLIGLILAVFVLDVSEAVQATMGILLGVGLVSCIFAFVICFWSSMLRAAEARREDLLSFEEVLRFRGFRGTVFYYYAGPEDFSHASLLTTRSDLVIFWTATIRLGASLAALGTLLASFLFNVLATWEREEKLVVDAVAVFSYGFLLLLLGGFLTGLGLPQYLGHATFNFWRRPNSLRLLALGFVLALSLMIGSSILGFHSVIDAKQNNDGTYFATIVDEVLFFVFFPLGATLFGTMCTYSWLPLGDWFRDSYGLDQIVFFKLLEEDLDPGTRLENALTADDLLSNYVLQTQTLRSTGRW